jgi:hypothetical protein
MLIVTVLSLRVVMEVMMTVTMVMMMVIIIGVDGGG